MRILTFNETVSISAAGKNCICEPCGCCSACIGIKQEVFVAKCERSFLGALSKIPLAIFQVLNGVFNPWARPSDEIEF